MISCELVRWCIRFYCKKLGLTFAPVVLQEMIDKGEAVAGEFIVGLTLRQQILPGLDANKKSTFRPQPL